MQENYNYPLPHPDSNSKYSFPIKLIIWGQIVTIYQASYQLYIHRDQYYIQILLEIKMLRIKAGITDHVVGLVLKGRD